VGFEGEGCFPPKMWRDASQQHNISQLQPFIRVILNGQIGCGGGGAGSWCGRDAGAVEVWRTQGTHASLKFEKDGSLAKRASGAKIDR